ncbi:MAG: hypothetical protein K0S65_2428 [Labilithrix sp.]|nr:hypothetical protein [Labilithrix sp.]
MLITGRGTRGCATRTKIAIAIASVVATGCARHPSPSRATDSEKRAATGIEASVQPGRTSKPTHDVGGAPAPSALERDRPPTTPMARTTLGPGFPESGPWLSFYGSAAEMRDIARVARTYRIINVDADPGMGNFTSAQLAALRAGGRNRVLSYMNVGACERFRTYWSSAPQGLRSCADNTAAHRGGYDGYPDETWMDLGNADYQALILEHVASRLALRVDGFYLDNLEIVEHTVATSNGPCSPACREGGLDLVRKLREKFPSHLIVMQNATSDVTRLGTTGGIPFPLLLDGVAHEEVYAPTHDATAESELVAWGEMGLSSRREHPFWIGVEDYVGSCRNTSTARMGAARARARGFSPYASDASAGQRVVCFWE